MRFAWLPDSAPDPEGVQQERTLPISLIRFAFNATFWIFLLLFFKAMDYGTGFIVFTIIIFVKLVVNLYTNNFFKSTVEQFEKVPLRIP